MDKKGDILDRNEIEPEHVDTALVSDEAKYKVQLVKEVLESGGAAHVYLGHTPPGADKHLFEYNVHVFEDEGLVYTHGDDIDQWIYGGDIEMVERHYEE